MRRADGMDGSEGMDGFDGMDGSDGMEMRTDEKAWMGSDAVRSDAATAGRHGRVRCRWRAIQVMRYVRIAFQQGASWCELREHSVRAIRTTSRRAGGARRE